MEEVFWISIGFMAYAYIGYPLMLYCLTGICHRQVRKASITPHVAFIVTAYNEESRITDKIKNALAQDYPRELVEIIVASDCSTDQTDAIVRSFADQGVRLVRATSRNGKEAAQQLAIRTTSAPIFVFSDVATVLPVNGISCIVKNFEDPSIGCVSSVDRFIDGDGKVSGEGLYVRYEMMLRKLESQVNSLVGLSGSFFAARREVCQSWAPDLQSDFNTLLNSVQRGLRGISDPESVGYYKNIADERKEFDRKVRTVLRGISVLRKALFMLNPFRYGLFSWQLFSHKVCRWLVPFALIMALVSNAFLALESEMYQYLFTYQMAFYVSAIVFMLVPPRHARLFKLQAFFLLVNLSILTAWYRYMRGDRIVGWEPSKR